MADFPPKRAFEDTAKTQDAMLHFEYLKAVAQHQSQQQQQQQHQADQRAVYPFGSLSAYSELLMQQQQRQNQAAAAAAQKRSMEDVLKKLTGSSFNPEVSRQEEASASSVEDKVKDHLPKEPVDVTKGYPGGGDIASLLSGISKGQPEAMEGSEKDAKLREILSHIYQYISKAQDNKKVS